jgi:hypothetical protein
VCGNNARAIGFHLLALGAGFRVKAASAWMHPIASDEDEAAVKIMKTYVSL